MRICTFMCTLFLADWTTLICWLSADAEEYSIRSNVLNWILSGMRTWIIQVRLSKIALCQSSPIQFVILILHNIMKLGSKRQIWLYTNFFASEGMYNFEIFKNFYWFTYKISWRSNDCSKLDIFFIGLIIGKLVYWKTNMTSLFQFHLLKKKRYILICMKFCWLLKCPIYCSTIDWMNIKEINLKSVFLYPKQSWKILPQ